MIRLILRLAAIAALATTPVMLASPASAQTTAVTPAVGTPVRKAIVDALRIPVQKDLAGKKVVFKINHLKVQNGFAFLSGTPRKENGKPFDYRGTQYQKFITEGWFDDGIVALLKKKSDKWVVVTFNIGSTDVSWTDWHLKYKAPVGIFPTGTVALE